MVMNEKIYAIKRFNRSVWKRIISKPEKRKIWPLCGIIKRILTKATTGNSIATAFLKRPFVSGISAAAAKYKTNGITDPM